MIGYVARDEDGQLYLYDVHPGWREDIQQWIGDCAFLSLDDEDFPEFKNLTYKNDPIKVKIKLEKV